ncbi:MAG: T9SS type A sorting domain-containing protein, partial [Phaeodactylibacter sp.]|nr:T9SS type A sorting domain-containing protein [Phaeodactylibacter sp.]
VANTKSVLINWTKWLWSTIGIRGFRMDAVKHFDPQFVSELLNDLHSSGMNPPMVVGEYYDDNAFLLKGWVDDVTSGMSSGASSAINVRIFDFALRKALKDACDGFNTNDCFGSGQDARKIFSSGIVDGAGGDPFNVVTFANNHDFRDAGQPIQNDPKLAYAYMLTNNQIGLPTIFYPDFYNITPPNYPVTYLQPELTKLMELHQLYIYGASARDYLNRCSTPYSSTFHSGYSHAALIYQLRGGAAGKDVIVAINFATDELDVDQQINTTNVPAGETFTDVLNLSSGPTHINLSGSNQLNLKVPGRSYAVWVQGSVPVFPVSLTAFQARLTNGIIVLDWQTETEHNFEGFELERSIDGIHFEKIQWIPGNGDAQQGADYHHYDRDYPQKKTLYYRLKAIDLDGSYEYSAIQTVELDTDQGGIQIHPNPFDDQLDIRIEQASSKDLRIQLFNIRGELVLHQTQGWSQSLSLDTSDLGSGIYFVRVFQGGYPVWNSKLFKQGE